jgi:glycosyltransferase involved in cell wall biosynthesis
MQPIRVLQVFTVLNIGGAETNLMNYYRKLNPNEIQMDFLVHREGGFFEQEVLDNGSKIFRLPSMHPATLRAYKKEVDAFFKEHALNYDIVHGQLSELGIIIYQTAKKYGIPVRIAHAHNSKMDWDLKAPFRTIWKHQMRKYINGFFSCGDESSVWLFGKKLAQKAFVMPNSIDVSRFKYDEQIVHQYKKDLGISKDYSFLHIGRFATQKNHTFLIDVFQKIVAQLPEAKLFLVGLGELQEKIEEKVKKYALEKNVIFLGRRDDVNQLMQTCNYFLFPSLYEGFSVAMIEAQASGMHSFISNSIPPEAILLKENVSVISLKKTSQDWADEIVKQIHIGITRDFDAYIKIKQAGYDVNDNVSLLYQEYKRLLNQHPRP